MSLFARVPKIERHGNRIEFDLLMQLSMGLYFTSFTSIAVFQLKLGLNGSLDSDAFFNFLLHCRKIETQSKSSGGVYLFLVCDGSE